MTAIKCNDCLAMFAPEELLEFNLQILCVQQDEKSPQFDLESQYIYLCRDCVFKEINRKKWSWK